MPLPSPSVERVRKHLRSVQMEGFKRADGLWELDARLVDTKDHDYCLASGLIRAGAPVHAMAVRIVFDDRFTIHEAVACTEAAPYPGACEWIVPDYSKIVGLNLFHGFLKTVREMYGGIQGCAHLTELLMHLPTGALQTYASDVSDGDDSPHKPYPLDRCHALASHSEVVKRYYPRWYRKEPEGAGQ